MSLFTSKTFAVYSALVSEPKADSWVGLKRTDAQELLDEIAASVPSAKDSALALFLDFLAVIGSQADEIVNFKFDENLVHTLTSAPKIRKKDGTYVLQVGEEALSLKEVRQLVKMEPKIALVGEGDDAKEYATFNFTLPTTVESDSDYGSVARHISFPIDAVTIKESYQSDELAAAFKKSPGSAETMSLVAEFKTGGFNPQLKDLGVGDYQIMSYETQTRSSDNSTWNVFVMTLADGSKVESNAKSRVVNKLGDPLAGFKLNKLISTGAGVWMRISSIEEKTNSKGDTKTYVDGDLFTEKPAPMKKGAVLKSAAPRQNGMLTGTEITLPTEVLSSSKLPAF